MRYWLRDHQIEARAALVLLSQLLREWTFATTMRKHGISFDEAGSAFLDQLALSGPDPDHSMGEPRYITFGMSSLGRLLAVFHTHRPGIIRIISARRFTSNHAEALKAKAHNFLLAFATPMDATLHKQTSLSAPPAYGHGAMHLVTP